MAVAGRWWLIPIGLILPLLSLGQTLIQTYDLKGLHNTARTGHYDKVMHLIQQQGVPLSLRHGPILRARYLFETKQVDCISPSDDPYYDFLTLKSKPLNLAKAYIFRRQGDEIITDPKGLKGVVVGITLGMGFSDEFDRVAAELALQLEPVRDIELNYKKLLAKRIDAFIAYTPDIWNIFSTQTIPQLAYDRNKPIAVLSDSIVCHQTPENQAFIHQFNLALDALNQQGVLKELLGISYNFD